MNIVRVKGTPAHGPFIDQITVWVDELVGWPDYWRSAELPGGATIYWNSEDSIHLPFAVENPSNHTGAMSVSGTIIEPDGSACYGCKREGLWSSRAGVFNMFVASEHIQAPFAVNVTVYDKPIKSLIARVGIATTIRLPALDAFLDEHLGIANMVHATRFVTADNGEATLKVLKPFDTAE